MKQRIKTISNNKVVKIDEINIHNKENIMNMQNSMGKNMRSGEEETKKLILNIFLLFSEDIVFLVYGLDEVKPAGDMLVLWLGVFWGREVIVREVGREVRLFIIFL